MFAPATPASRSSAAVEETNGVAPAMKKVASGLAWAAAAAAARKGEGLPRRAAQLEDAVLPRLGLERLLRGEGEGRDATPDLAASLEDETVAVQQAKHRRPPQG